MKKLNLFFVIFISIVFMGCKGPVQGNLSDQDQFISYMNKSISLYKTDDLFSLFYPDDNGMIENYGMSDEEQAILFSVFKEDVLKKKETLYAGLFDTKEYNRLQLDNAGSAPNDFLSYRDQLISGKSPLRVMPRVSGGIFVFFEPTQDNANVFGFIIEKKQNRFYITGVINGFLRSMLPKS